MRSSSVKQTRRTFLRAALAGATTLAATRGFGDIRPKRTKRPNVLFLFSDDQRADTIHALGNAHVRTPNLDRLVQSGTAFTNAYIMGGSCPAVCAPSRAMLLTGRSLWRLDRQGMWNYEISEKNKTMPEVFREAGYATFQTGKWHQREGSFKRGFTTGKNVWFGGTGDHFRILPCDYAPPETDLVPEKTRRSRQKAMGGGPRGAHSSEAFANGMISFLTERPKDRPFFAYVAFFAPHDQRIAPKEYHAMYPPEDLPLPGNFMPQHPFDNGEMKIRDEKLERWPRTKSAIQKHLSDYYAIITHMDAQIGRILDALKESGEYENTIIVFSSDNGLAIGSHGLMGKQSVYEHSVRVPLIVSGPGVPRNERRSTFCFLLDIFPTLCDVIGLPVPKTVEGKSFAAAFRNPRTRARDALYFSYMNVQRAVREGRYKLIEYHVKGKRTTQLFDLETDPLEMNNLASDDNHKEALARLRERLVQLRDEYADKTNVFWRGC